MACIHRYDKSTNFELLSKDITRLSLLSNNWWCYCRASCGTNGSLFLRLSRGFLQSPLDPRAVFAVSHFPLLELFN
jgi:hypothetical protein